MTNVAMVDLFPLFSIISMYSVTFGTLEVSLLQEIGYDLERTRGACCNVTHSQVQVG